MSLNPRGYNFLILGTYGALWEILPTEGGNGGTMGVYLT